MRRRFGPVEEFDEHPKPAIEMQHLLDGLFRPPIRQNDP